MANSPLFRAEALAHRDAPFLGRVIVLLPPSYSMLVAGALSLMVGFVLFLGFGHYTHKEFLSGQLMPAAGLIRIEAPRAGVIVARRVAEGDSVRKGQTLFVISAERQSAVAGGTQEAISRQLNLRRESLAGQLESTRTAQRQEREQLDRTIEGLSAEERELAEQIAVQTQRIEGLQSTLSRFEKVAATGVVSSVQLQEKRDSVLEQTNVLHGLRRNQFALAQSFAAARAQRQSLPLRQSAELEVLSREAAGLAEAFAGSEAAREFVIVASADGTVSAIRGEVGQAVNESMVLANLVPRASPLEARLYASSRAVGFIAPGKPVLLQYQAFPYQKFGQYRGRVIAVSRATVSADEARGSTLGAQTAEGFYRVTVALESQAVKAYGMDQALQPGMDVRGAVALDDRRLIEWIFEPLYGAAARL